MGSGPKRTTQAIARALMATGGDVKKAADTLGIHARTVERTVARSSTLRAILDGAPFLPRRELEPNPLDEPALNVAAAIHALDEAYGVVGIAAEALGVSRFTLQAFASRHPDVDKSTGREAVCDLAEAAIVAILRDPESKKHFEAVKFVLSTQGSSRGWVQPTPPPAVAVNLLTDGGPSTIVVKIGGGPPELEPIDMGRGQLTPPLDDGELVDHG